MVPVRRMLFLVIFLSFITAGFAFGSATNVYITPDGNPAGKCPTGANTHNATWFNATANWGSGAAQIGPGSTVLLCGTFTFAAGATGLTVQGSGTSANPITIAFDSGAILQSPGFGGFGSSNYSAGIVVNGVNYITVDGKNTGTIQNTLNGTAGQTCLGGACSVHQSSLGMYIHNTTGVAVQNLTIQDIYMDKNAEQGNAAWYSGDIYTDGPNSSVVIQGNVLNDAHVGAWISFDNGSTTANVFNNTIAHHAWQISWANGSSKSSTSSGAVYNNDLSNYDDWNAGGSGSFHTDGVIQYTVSGAPTFNLPIYNNYFHGDLDGGTGAGTAHISCGTTNPSSTCTAFNNIIDMSSSTHCAAGIWIEGDNSQIYDNTILGPSKCSTGASYGIVFQGKAATLNNNLISTVSYVLGDPGPYGTIASEITASDNNDFYNCLSSTCFAFSVNYNTLAEWQKGTKFDADSVNSNPNLGSNYTLPSGSPAISLGANLTGLNISPLDTSAPMNFGVGGGCGSGCLNRPTGTTAWDAGAEASGVGVPPPTGLVATVN